MLIDNGTHSVDIMRYFLGPLAEVQAVEGRRIQDIAGRGHRAACSSAAPRGVMGSIDLSWSVNKELPNFISIYGSAGTLHVGWKESKFRRAGDADWIVFGSGYDKVQAFRSQIDNFAALDPRRGTAADHAGRRARLGRGDRGRLRRHVARRLGRRSTPACRSRCAVA